MGKIVVTQFISLDGIVGDPQLWSFPYGTADLWKFKLDELFATDAQLLGRITYEGFAEAWPSQTDEAGFADRMNSLPKYVVSTTLQKAEWTNSTIIAADVPAELAKLKQTFSGDILVAGSVKLIATLMAHDLVDEYRLLTYPIVLGQGQRLFLDGSQAKLKLTEAKAYDTGVVLLRYERADAAPAAPAAA